MDQVDDIQSTLMEVWHWQHLAKKVVVVKEVGNIAPIFMGLQHWQGYCWQHLAENEVILNRWVILCPNLQEYSINRDTVPKILRLTRIRIQSMHLTLFLLLCYIGFLRSNSFYPTAYPLSLLHSFLKMPLYNNHLNGTCSGAHFQKLFQDHQPLSTLSHLYSILRLRVFYVGCYTICNREQN